MPSQFLSHVERMQKATRIQSYRNHLASVSPNTTTIYDRLLELNSAAQEAMICPGPTSDGCEENKLRAMGSAVSQLAESCLKAMADISPGNIDALNGQLAVLNVKCDECIKQCEKTEVVDQLNPDTVLLTDNLERWMKEFIKCYKQYISLAADSMRGRSNGEETAPIGL